MTADILVFDVRKRRPQNWVRYPCAVPECSRAEALGTRRLCNEHHDA